MLKNLIYTSRVYQRMSLVTTARSYVRRLREPGIEQRIKAFSEDFLENDPETIEAMEPDFMNVDEAHKQFTQEERQHRQKVSSMIVGRKYFKEKGVNFLTWSEKEQIRLLNQKDPEKWTTIKLSESFPADPTTISMIIRNKWQPRDEKRIYKHDEVVICNWNKFKAGELEVDPMLKEHLNKFTHRNFNQLTKPTTNRKLGTVVPKPSSSEFLSIITSCEKYAEKPESQKPEAIESSSSNQNLLLESDGISFPTKRDTKNPEDDTFLMKGNNNNRKMMPLREYQKISPDINLPEKQKEEDKEVIPREPFTKFKSAKDYETGITSLEFDDKQVFKSLEIKEQIKIPKKVWKRNQIYKVGDCFYSDDGEFLYRVPGLT